MVDKIEKKKKKNDKKKRKKVKRIPRKTEESNIYMYTYMYIDFRE